MQGAVKNIDEKPMTDDEATDLHWLMLECLTALLNETN